MDIGTILLYIALTMVLLWTVRIARSKSRNAWLWGGAAFILMVIPNLNLLGVIPMVVLMFLKSPQNQGEPIIDSSGCPRCQASLLRNSRFCTSCGWDLAERYYPETAPVEEPSAPTQAVESREHVAVADPPGQSAAEDAPQEPPVDTTPEVTPPPFTPPKKPVTLVLPTAAGMTERGVGLFNQGRIQESIDQFTKAIALDANYIQAWARRAEAYARLGRGNEAAEDQRRLDALNASL